MTAFEIMQKHYHQRDIAAKQWKEKGGQVVGFFCDIVPEEMILASGFFPLRLSGAELDHTKTSKDIFSFHRGGPPESFVASIFNKICCVNFEKFKPNSAAI